MRKNIYFLILLVLLLTSCGLNGKESVNNKNDSVDIGGRKEELLDLEKYSVENQGTIHDQPGFLWNCAANSDFGVYYWGNAIDSMEKLMFYDKSSKFSVYLCNRPNCNHTDDTCNASFNAYGSGSEKFYRNMIFCYDNSVFLVGNDEKHYVNLYRVESDGSSWEKYMTLFKAEMTTITENGMTTTSWRYPDVCLHEDYVYYIDNSESAPKLRRIQMCGKEVEVIFEPEGEQTLLYRMMCYGDFVFVQAGKYVGEEIVAGIYAYNTKTEEITLVKANAIRGYCIAGEVLYYESNEKIYKYDLKTGRNDELPITSPLTAVCEFFADENGIYLFNSSNGKLEVYDETGILLMSVVDKQIRECGFGEDGIFYGMVGDGSGRSAILEIKDVLSGNGKWLYIQ